MSCIWSENSKLRTKPLSLYSRNSSHNKTHHKLDNQTELQEYMEENPGSLAMYTSQQLKYSRKTTHQQLRIMGFFPYFSTMLRELE